MRSTTANRRTTAGHHLRSLEMNFRVKSGLALGPGFLRLRWTRTRERPEGSSGSSSETEMETLLFSMPQIASKSSRRRSILLAYSGKEKIGLFNSCDLSKGAFPSIPTKKGQRQIGEDLFVFRTFVK